LGLNKELSFVSKKELDRSFALAKEDQHDLLKLYLEKAYQTSYQYFPLLIKKKNANQTEMDGRQ
jgi:hypothetical protein